MMEGERSFLLRCFFCHPVKHRKHETGQFAQYACWIVGQIAFSIYPDH